MEIANLSQVAERILELLAKKKIMNSSEVASTLKMDRRLVAYNLSILEDDKYVESGIMEEKESGLKRYYKVLLKGWNYIESRQLHFF